MERLVTSVDQHGRMLIPSHIREKLNIFPGEKVTLEINHNQISIINTDSIVEEMHALFTKNQVKKENSIVDDFIKRKRLEHKIEEVRSIKDV